jgi:hypothetical protein
MAAGPDEQPDDTTSTGLIYVGFIRRRKKFFVFPNITGPTCFPAEAGTQRRGPKSWTPAFARD